MDDWETVIGLECHVELSTRTKMFCGCRNEFGAEPNTNVCPVCLGHPGSLPVPNRAAIASIVKIGLALGSKIAEDSLFHRKNYFYPDMPKNYQISQYDLPICVGGHLAIEVDGAPREIGITRVHMEEDTGKTSHSGTTGRIAQADYALVDFNRAGVPLVEVVSEPDLRSPEEARGYLTELRAILRAIGVSDVRMEEGSLRCDANISTRPAGDEGFGTRVEIKNLNSIRSLERALRFEQGRQRAALAAGRLVVQETRHFEENTGRTHTLRSKEEAFDYRYFPEPDLPPLQPDERSIDEIRASLPELPAARRSRYVREQGLTRAQAAAVVGSDALAALFDATLAAADGAAPPAVAIWVTQNVVAVANEHGIDLDALPIDAAQLATIIGLVEAGTISPTAGKQVLEEVVVTGVPAERVVEEKGLRQVSEASALEKWVDEAIADNPGPVEQFRGGKPGAINVLVGQVMKKSRNAANAQAVRAILEQRLSGS